MADLSSGDRPEKSSNGTSNRQHASSIPASGVLCDERALADSDQTAAARVDSARERDVIADARDLAGLTRDHAATLRDVAMTRSDAEDARGGTRAVTGAEIVLRAAWQRKRATEHRAQAAEHRMQAARDRDAAATDREQAARDRLRARADREVLSRTLAVAEIDPLTGARNRAAGLTDLDRELDRCRRTHSTLVVAYVDAVGLQRVDDSDGHDDADRLLKRVVTLIAEHLRSYDLIVRLDGNELLCAMSDMTIPGARERFRVIASALAGTSEAGALRTSFAKIAADETATDLVARADSQLIASRHG